MFKVFLDYVTNGNHIVMFRETSAQHFHTPNGLYPLKGGGGMIPIQGMGTITTSTNPHSLSLLQSFYPHLLCCSSSSLFSSSQSHIRTRSFSHHFSYVLFYFIGDIYDRISIVSSVSLVADKLNLSHDDSSKSSGQELLTHDNKTLGPLTSNTLTSGPRTNDPRTNSSLIIEVVNASTTKFHWRWHCAPLSTDPTVLAAHNWRNIMVAKILSELDPGHQHIPIIPYFRYTAARHDFHVETLGDPPRHCLLIYSL